MMNELINEWKYFEDLKKPPYHELAYQYINKQRGWWVVEYAVRTKYTDKDTTKQLH